MTNPKRAGRKIGSTKDRANINTTISRENAEWLREQKERGFPIATTLDRLINHGKGIGNTKCVKKDRDWRDYPEGTKAMSFGGGYWEKTNRGWKWCTGATFPAPGGDASGWVQLPTT